jgi:hypothetical protein
LPDDRFDPAECLLNALVDALAGGITTVPDIRASTAELRPLVFCATCGATSSSATS